jgi:hypothetical protein
VIPASHLCERESGHTARNLAYLSSSRSRSGRSARNLRTAIRPDRAVSSAVLKCGSRVTSAYTAPEAAAAPAGIGDTVQDGSFSFTVTDVHTGPQILGESFMRSEAQGEYVLVDVAVTNVSSESAMFSGFNQTLLDAQGREFSADSGAAVMNVPDSESFLSTINPGNSLGE